MSKLMRCAAGIVKLTLFALYLFAFYELTLIPAILDWSVYGILFTLTAAGLLIYSLPADRRRNLTVLGLAFLLSVKAMDNLSYLTWYGRTAGTVVIFLILFIISRLAGKVSLRRFTTVFLVALLINLTLNLVEVPLWTEFSVLWRSPVLYKQEGTVDYFPLQLADVNNDSKSEIIVQGNPEAVNREREGIAEDNEKHRLLNREDNKYLVFAWTKRGFTQLENGKELTYSTKKLLDSLQPDYVNFPFYSAEWQKSQDGLQQKLTPLLDREELAERTVRFGDAPFVTLALDLQSLEQRLKTQPIPPFSMTKPFALRAAIADSQLTGTFAGQSFSIPTEATAILGAGRLLKGSSAQLVVLGEKLQIIDISQSGSARVIGQISSAEVPDIGTAEGLLADVNVDGEDELLLNTEHAKILKLDKDGKWQVLWSAAPDDTSFRFEGFAALGKNEKPQIIALSRSNVRKNLTRYMTGYDYTSSGLKQKWRVFTGPLINLRAADVDGDGSNELAGYIYKKHIVLVMKKHQLPIIPILYGLTAVLIIWGLARKAWPGRAAEGGEGRA